MSRKCQVCGTTDGRYEWRTVPKVGTVCNICFSSIGKAWKEYGAKDKRQELCPNCGGKGYVFSHNGPYYRIREEMREILADANEKLKLTIKELKTED